MEAKFQLLLSPIDNPDGDDRNNTMGSFINDITILEKSDPNLYVTTTLNTQNQKKFNKEERGLKMMQF